MAHGQGESRGSAILASVIALAITLPGCSEDQDNAYLGPEIFEMYDQFPAWSPAGDRIAFRYQARDLGEQQGIWLVDSDGQNARPLINGDLPSWSPDGRELAYVRDAQICVLIMDTGETVQLTHSGRNWFPTWSPSGEMLTFDRTAPIDSAGLWIICACRKPRPY